MPMPVPESATVVLPDPVPAEEPELVESLPLTATWPVPGAPDPLPEAPAPQVFTTYSRDVALSDGSGRLLEAWTRPTFFQAVDGSWSTIDTTAVAVPGVGYVASAVASSTLIPLVASGAVQVPSPAGTFDVVHGGASGAAGLVVSGAADTVRYEDAYGDAALLVTLRADGGFKESLVLDAPGGPSSYDDLVTMPAGVTARQADGGVEFVADGVVVAAFRDGWAFDSSTTTAGVDGVPVTVELVGVDAGTARLRVAVEVPGWVEDPARVYPVTIDPTWEVTPEASGAVDTYVNSDNCLGNYELQTELRVGSPQTVRESGSCTDPWGTAMNTAQWSRTRTMMDFTIDNMAGRGFDVTSANISMELFASSSSLSKEYNLYALNGDVTSANNVRWASQPGRITTTRMSSALIANSIGSRVTFSLNNTADLAQRWFDGTYRCCGIAVTRGAAGSTEYDSASFRQFYAQDRGNDTRAPRFSAVYVRYPYEPTNVSASAGEGSANVYWTAPNNGGSSITSYTVYVYNAANGGLISSVPVACGTCTSATVSGLSPGSYFFKVSATNRIGEGPTSAASNTVTVVAPLSVTKVLGSIDASGLASCASPGRSSFVRGEPVVFCVRVTNQYSSTQTVSVSDTVPASVALGTPGTVRVNGGLCGTACSISGSTLSVSGLSIAGGTTTSVAFPTTAVGNPQACATFSNVATASSSKGSASGSVPFSVCDAGLGAEPWWSFVSEDVGPQAEAMVNVANGNLLIRHTDSTPVQGHGRLGYVLRRTYNSADQQLLSLPGSIGAGWLLNVGQSGNLAGTGVTSTGLYVPNAESATTAGAVTLIDRDGTRHVFRPKQVPVSASIDATSPLSGALGALNPLVLARNLNTTSHKLCVDQTYQAPAGVHLGLWRYVRVSATSSCTAPSGGTVLGFAAMRPDRVRYEYSWDGRLVSMVDANGNELRYSYENLGVDATPPVAPTSVGRLMTVWEPRICADPGVATCRAFRFSYPDTTTVRVSDPAGRSTGYTLDTAIPARLVRVDNPDGTNVAYTYGTCGGTAQQVCSVTDPRGKRTSFAYTSQSLGRPRLTSMSDRRVNDADSAALATTFAYATNLTTVDQGTHRERYSQIDTEGRVGEIAQGNTSNVYSRQAVYTWDKPGATCRQPDNAVDNNLCRLRRLALNSGATPDEDTSWIYNPEGKVLAERRVNGAATLSSTNGWRAQVVASSGTSVVTDTVAGSGNVTSETRPTGAGVLFAIADQSQQLTPRGNAAGSNYSPYLTTHTRDWLASAKPTAAPTGTTCADPGAPNANTGNLCQTVAPASTGMTGGATTRYTYDQFGQRSTMTTPNAIADGSNQSYAYTYYTAGDLDLSGGVSASGWLKTVTDPTGNFVAYAYDRAGNQARAWDRNATDGTNASLYPGTASTPAAPGYSEVLHGTGTTALSAPWRYVRARTDQLGNHTTVTVDNNGNETTIRPPRGNAAGNSGFDTTQTFDAAGNLLSRQLPAEAVSAKKWRYQYDAWDNQTATIDPNGMVTTVVYDAVNRPTTRRFTRNADTANLPVACRTSTTADAPIPAGRVLCDTVVAYDGVDNQTATQDASDQTTNYTFDGVHREIRRLVPRNDGTHTTLRTDSIYDADGNITIACAPREFTEGSGSCTATSVHATHQSWDAAGRLATRTTRRQAGSDQTTSYRYDANGNQTAQTDPNGRSTEWAYDLLDRRTTQLTPRASGLSYSTGWRYDPSGNVTAQSRPDGIDTGSGTDGALVVDGTGASTDGHPHPAGDPFLITDDRAYTSITLRNGGAIRVDAPTPIHLRASGTVTICATCTVTIAPTGATSDGTGGAGGNSTLSGGGGGGAGHTTAGQPGQSLVGSTGSPGTAGPATTTGFAPGAPGGPGGTANGDTPGGPGGPGGGALRLSASRIDLAGTIAANGAPGQPGPQALSLLTSGGGGGGGAGGAIWLTASTLNISSASSLTVAGGPGGTAPNSNAGGAGGRGHVRLDAGTYTGPETGPSWPEPETTHVGLITAYSYDAAHRVIDTVHGADHADAPRAGTPAADGSTNARTRNVYDPDGNVIGVYEPRAFATSVTDPDERYLTRTDHDPNGRPTATWTPRWDSTAASDLGAPAGSTEQTTNCPTGQAPSAAGLPDYPASTGVCVTRTEYDPAGNRATLTLPTATGQTNSNRYLSYRYTDDNLLAAVTSPSPATTGARVTAQTVTYDANGRQVRTVDANGNARTWAYRSDGLLASTTGQPGPNAAHTETYAYDANGNQTRRTEPAGAATVTTYYADNLVRDITDGAGNKTSYVYDANGNPTQVKSPAANAAAAPVPSGVPTVNSFTWDNLLESTTVPVAPDATASIRRRTAYTYDAAGRRASTQVYETDATGTPLAGRDAGTQILTWTPTDRLDTQTGPTGATITTDYDPAGNPTAIVDSTSNSTLTATWYLDGLWRSVDNGAGHTSDAAYDGTGNRTLRADHTSTDATTSRYSFNDAGLAATATSDVTGTGTFTWTYDSAGRPTGQSSPNGTSIAWTYNSDDTLNTQTLRQGTTTLGSWTYTWDANYRQLSQAHTDTTGAAATFSYTYDNAGRVATFTAGTQTNYGYDPNNNRTSVSSPATTYTFNADDSLRTISTRGATPLTYGPDGNQTDDGCTTNAYDDFDRLTATTPRAGTGCPSPDGAVTYTYDGLDRQTTRTQDGTTTGYHYDGTSQDVLAHTQPSDTTVYGYSPNGRPLALDTTTGSPQLITGDGDNNTAIITNDQGNVVCATRYDPWGNPRTRGGTFPTGGEIGTCTDTLTANDLWYGSGRRDNATGNYQFGARTYNPNTASFLSADNYRTGPAEQNLSIGTDPLTRNSYSYVNGDPINLTDPSGHAPCFKRSRWGIPRIGWCKDDFTTGAADRFKESLRSIPNLRCSFAPVLFVSESCRRVIGSSSRRPFDVVGAIQDAAQLDRLRSQGTANWLGAVVVDIAAAVGLRYAGVRITAAVDVDPPPTSRGIASEAPTASRGRSHTEAQTSEPGRRQRGTAPQSTHGVSFFGDDVAQYYKASDATLGAPGKPHFFMPVDDAGIVRNANDAARYTGMAPSATNAYLTGGNVYGIAFPTRGLGVRVPTAADAGGYVHFLEGGRTAVRTAGPRGGYLLNPPREFVTQGGRVVPQGSVLFRLGTAGEWIIERRF